MRYLKISKELIRNVLEKETENLPDDFTFDIIDNYIIFADDGECMFEVNIYELAHKCKEWSLTMGYFIYSTNELAFIKTLSLETLDIVFSNGDMNECECILKACEWIFKQGENK